MVYSFHEAMLGYDENNFCSIMYSEHGNEMGNILNSSLCMYGYSLVSVATDGCRNNLQQALFMFFGPD